MSYKSILNVVVVAVVVMSVMFVGCGGKKETKQEKTANNKTAQEKSKVVKTVKTFTDKRGGKKYKTIKIGTAVWMAENLNYAAKGSVCYENKDANCAKYGRLYNWETALNACPAGFHFPSDKEWTELTDAVGGWSTAGTKLKSAAGWKENGNGTNDYGWSALPGGLGSSGGSFSDAGIHGFWWSATERSATYAGVRIMRYSNEDVIGFYERKNTLLSVRCVQDN